MTRRRPRTKRGRSEKELGSIIDKSTTRGRSYTVGKQVPEQNLTAMMGVLVRNISVHVSLVKLELHVVWDVQRDTCLGSTVSVACFVNLQETQRHEHPFALGRSLVPAGCSIRGCELEPTTWHDYCGGGSTSGSKPFEDVPSSSRVSQISPAARTSQAVA